MNRKSLFWKIPLGVLGVLFGLVFLLLIAVGCVLYVPSLRKAALEKALPVVQEQTGMDIDLGELYLSPFHHSPLTLYRAYKGEADLPLEVNIDSLFVGHRGQDTLLYAHAAIGFHRHGQRRGQCPDEQLRHIAIDGFFLAIGHHPNTELFKDYIARDAEGYIIVKDNGTQCFSLPFREGQGVGSILPGIFAAGDCADPHYRQAVVAAGSGAKAAIEADKYIKSLG